MLERHEVETFLTLFEELHFGRTAERLHVSTARVSQTVRKLERRVGAPLFDRTSRRVEPTAAGRRLYERVRPAWDEIGAAFQEAVAAGRGLTGTLRAAFVGAAAAQLLVGVTGLFRERVPGCEVRVREAQWGEVAPWLREDRVDVALTTFPVEAPDLTMGPVLVREARVLAVAAGHPFARRATVSVEDLARVTVLPLLDTPATTPSGRPVVHGPPAATLNELLALVGADQGVLPVGAQTRRYYARPDVVYVPFEDAPRLEWGLVWRTETARVRAFSEAARDLLRASRT
ncbi:LysR family transcriptional regulator [Actinomadura kijaniata]|uniref:LysR family transcriptional regulator n=1 Tax=Actinomadura kijaniata TaxID=46161 RepID=UPI000830863F|nr:LysR family transcriptional regulator [Actinomadura kijaniata]